MGFPFLTHGVLCGTSIKRVLYGLVCTMQVEESIHEVATETVSQVRRQERQLVAALHAMCGADDETLAARKKALSEHVRRLEDACNDADQLLLAITQDRGPSAFLLQRQRTVDAMTSLMTLQTTSVNDWPNCERQVRFEAYGLDSALGLRVGRLIIDNPDSDVESGCEQSERDGVTFEHGTQWTEVTLSDKNVQTDELDQSVPPRSRCEASGSVSARPNVSHDQHVMTGASPTSTRCRPASPPPPPPPAAAAAAGSSTSLCDASTSTATVSVVSSWTATDQLQPCDEPTQTIIITHDQQTSTELSPHVQHRAAGTDPLQTCSVGVTAAPLTDVKSTWTVHSNDHTWSVASDAHSKLFDVDENVTQSGSFSTCSVATVDDDTAPHMRRSCSLLSAQSPVTSPQPAATASNSSSADLVAGLAQLTSALNTGDCHVSTAIPPALRLTALLPEIERTADVLAASHFSSGLTARLLREVVDVGLQMTSSCMPADTATKTTDEVASSTVSQCYDDKWTQTEAVSSDVVRVNRGVGQSVVTTSETSTLTNIAPMTFDKETSTARTHQVNKNVATDSLSTADKQTWMAIDVATAYLACTAGAATRQLVSRGTLTPAAFSELPPQHLVERGTSPVRVTLVDKSVTASKAEALEPVDTFQAAGQLSGPLSPRSRRPLSLSPRSKLACIRESAEHYDEEEKVDAVDALDVSELSDVSQTTVAQIGLRSTELPTTCNKTRLLQQPQHSRDVFDFDQLVTRRFGSLLTKSQRSQSLDDDLAASSAACDSDRPNLSASAGEMCFTAVEQSAMDECPPTADT